MKPISADIAAGLVAAAILLIFLFLLRGGVPLSIGAGALGYLGGRLVFTSKPKRLTMVAEGITADELSRILGEGQQKVNAIKQTGQTIADPAVKAQVVEICSLAAKILSDLKKDPKGIKSARQFLSYYLDTTSYIVTRYAELSGSAGYSEQVKRTLEKAEQTLTLIQQTFIKQMERLLENDAVDLDVELDLLKNTIKTEGL